MVFRGVPSEMTETLGRVNQPFAVWSETDTGLLAARDHLGIAPLFYTRGRENGWTLGTSVGEILDQAPETKKRLDDRSVIAHIAGPAPPDPSRTFYAGIRAARPGTLTRFTSEKTDTIRYWKPSEISPRNGLDIESAARELRETLIEVIADEFTDRRVAMFVDGSPGSALVLGTLVEAGADVEAITWKPAGIADSKERAARSQRLARKLRVVLTELPMDIEELLPETGVVTRRSTPYVDRFDHMRRVTANAASERDCDILYTSFGEGHLFGGSLPAAADLLMTLRLGQLSEYLSNSRQGDPDKTPTNRLVSPIVRQLIPGLGMRRHKPVPWLDERRREEWQQRQRAMIGPGLLPGRARRISRLTDGSIAQVSEDLTALARPHGIEVHHPLLDRRLVEFALSLPSWLLQDGQTDRLVLREAMVGFLPKEAAELGSPLPEVVAREALRARGSQLLGLATDMRAADLGYVDETVFLDHVAGFLREEHDDTSFWNTLTLEDWLRRWW